MITGAEAKIITGLADNDLRVAATCRQLFMHRNTVQYHIDKIKRKTQKDPTKFYDMCELLPMAKAIYKEE